MTKIGYVDNEEDETLIMISEIEDFNENFKSSIELTPIDLNEELLENIITEIMNNKLSGLIVDHLLNDDGKVPFQGSDIMNKILEEIPDFPVIVLTNDINDAENNSRYVHKVYSKKEELNFLSYEEDEEIKEEEEEPVRRKNDFLIISRLMKDINNFNKKILDYEEDVQSLIKKTQAEKLSPYEEEELIDKNRFLEKIYSGKHVPKHLLKYRYEEMLSEIINNSLQILNKLEKK